MARGCANIDHMRLAFAALVVVVAVAACGPSDREHDCAEVRAIVDTERPGQFDRLRRVHYRDAEVRDAVDAMLRNPSDRVAVLKPNPSLDDMMTATERLASLCKLNTRPIP